MANRQQEASEERRITAWHEAGHAVAAVLLGIEVSVVSVLPDAEGLGRYSRTDTELPILARGAPSSRTGRLLLVALCGLAAQRLIQPDAHDRDGRDDLWGARTVEPLLGEYPSRADRRAAWTAARQVVILAARQQAADLVQRHRRRIELVASALMERDELTGEEVRRIVAEARARRSGRSSPCSSDAAPRTDLTPRCPTTPTSGSPAVRASSWLPRAAGDADLAMPIEDCRPRSPDGASD